MVRTLRPVIARGVTDDQVNRPGYYAGWSAPGRFKGPSPEEKLRVALSVLRGELVA